MAHMISEVLGRAECFTAGEKPWHGLGINVPERVNSREAIELAGLDWKVKQSDVFGKSGQNEWDATMHQIPDKKINYREGANGEFVYLGLVSDRYRIIQNTEAFEFFDNVIGDNMAVYETAGAIRNGSRVWILAKLPENMIIQTKGGEDEIEKYLLFMNGHDGMFSCRMFYTPVRVVCNNTLSMAIRGKGKGQGVTIRHTGNIDDKVKEAVRILKIANMRYQDMELDFQQMATKNIGIDFAHEYFRKLFPDDEEDPHSRKQKNAEGYRDICIENFRRGAGADLAGNTLWGAYNSVTQFADHQKFMLRNPKHEYSRFESTVFGTNARLKKKAFKLANKMAGIA